MTPALPHHVQWVTASPLWRGAEQTAMLQPALLRFESDEFMEELIAELKAGAKDLPKRVLSALKSSQRSYRDRQPGEPIDIQPYLNELKLYQPAHGHYYLVAGSLVCALPGLPDHVIDVGAGDRVGFVLRRIEGPDELALCVDTEGKKRWTVIDDPEALGAGEELTALFPLSFQEDGQRRRLLAGLIPTASQDQLLATPTQLLADPKKVGRRPDELIEEIDARVVRAIQLLRSAAPAPSSDNALEISRFILLDLADFLQLHFATTAWDLIKHDKPVLANTKVGALVLTLRSCKTESGTTFADILKTILEQPLSQQFEYDLRTATGSQGLTKALFTAAIEEVSGSKLDDLPAFVQQASAVRFKLRLIYQCCGERTLCGPLKPSVVSRPSDAFSLASFYDSDAPGRPIRIALPIDTSISGLRKLRKNVSFVLSEALKDKIKGIGTIKGDIEGPNFDCGGISISIPILTICALIVLFIFLNLLNLVFWWLPFVKICLPKIKVEA